MNLRLKELYTLYSVQELAEHCLHEESENKILNNRINKAIEYFEENYRFSNLGGDYEFYGDGYEFLKILHGDDEE